MLCPLCKAELIVTGQERLETLSEHVCKPNGEISLKNKYECSNSDCETRGLVMWNSDGKIYSNFETDTPFEEWKTLQQKMNNLPYIASNDAPFGSFQRRMNVEIYKKDENHPLFGIKTRWGYIEVKYSYESNNEGDILSRKRHYEIWVKKDKNCSTHILYTPGIHMLLYIIKDFHRRLKHKVLRKDDLYVPFKTDKRWWSRLGHWYARTFLRIFKPAKWKELTA